jgi:hypothetical protein
MPDYQQSKIYKLYSPSKNLVYYGSTVQPLSQRLAGHISSYKLYIKDNNKKYLSSFLVLECEDYKIELVEAYPCNNNQQLLRKEGEYQKNNVCINKNINYTTINKCYEAKTNYEQNKEEIIKRAKTNYEQNKEEIIKRVKEYQKINADKIKEREKKYRYANVGKIKENIKNYRYANADKIKEQRHQYYLKQKELKKGKIENV